MHFKVTERNMLISQVFQRKNDERRLAGERTLAFKYPEYNSATVRIIFMILGRIVEQIIAECRK